MIMSDEGFRIAKSHENALVAEINAEHGIYEAMTRLMADNNCRGTLSGSVNGGSYEVTMYPVENLCFVFSKGEKGEGVHFKVAYLKVGSTVNLATLTVNNFTGSDFFFSYGGRLVGDEECNAPALAYYNCEEDCSTIDWAVSRGRIESVEKLDYPIDIAEVLFSSELWESETEKENREEAVLESLKEFVYDKFEEEYPPEGSFNTACVIEGASTCTVSSVIACDAGTVSAADCNNVLIKGDDLTIIVNGSAPTSLTVNATGNVSITGGVASQLEGDLYLKAKNISITLFSDASIKGKLVSYAEETFTYEGLFGSASGSDEQNVIVAGDLVDLELMFDATFDNIGYVATLNDGGVISLNYHMDRVMEGFFVSDYFVIPTDLRYSTELRGIIVTNSIGTDENGLDSLTTRNSALIQGLVVVFDDMQNVELRDSSRWQGLFIMDNANGLQIMGSARMEPDFELVNDLIKTYGLEDFFNKIECGAVSSGSKLKAVVPPTSLF